MIRQCSPTGTGRNLDTANPKIPITLTQLNVIIDIFLLG